MKEKGKMGTITKFKLLRSYVVIDKCHNIVDTMKCQEIEDSVEYSS